MEEQLFTLPETNRTKLEDLIWVVGTTKFKPLFDQVFAFSDAKQAFSYLVSGYNIGKTVIHISPPAE